MGTVGVKELKNRLTHYLQRTQQGEEIVVTDRGKPIAVLRSIQDAPTTTLEAKLAQLAAQGRLILPTHHQRWRGRPVRIPGPYASQTVLEDRR